ncbi:MAG: carboxypeptidase-like regulatory domain-containing protein [Reichenbachiella sp.]|uniref:carboxypeptidase-like regulatory domain-containing protein n=2 Tax=Reichenbachiella sp. TaxID=2184521 RepID=UPI003264C4A0
MKLSIILTAILVVGQLHAQKLVSGRVISKQSNAPLAFANIGILNSTVGTFSFEDGSFNIIIPSDKLNDRLTFSALGYDKLHLNLSTLDSTKLVVSLKESTKVLNEVNITAGREILNGTWGLTKVKSATGYSCTRGTGGFAMASFVPVGDEVFGIKKVNFFIGVSQLESYMMRVRFQAVEANNQPGEDLFHENIIVTSNIREGWIGVDVTKYNIQFNQDFFLVIEWIMDESGTLKMLEYDANPLSWDIVGSTIVNQKKMTYFDDDGEKITVELTEEQIAEYKARVLPKVYIGSKKRNRRSTPYSYWREGNMAPWTREYDHELVANFEYEY